MAAAVAFTRKSSPQFGLVVGTLQLGRALTDRDLSDRLLARGVETALKLLDDFAR
jgi:TetR/AcrR family transcriptional regulator, transcriptional repressor for nem operon